MGKKRGVSHGQHGLHGFATSYERIGELFAESNAQLARARYDAMHRDAQAIGIGRALLNQEVVDESLERLRIFGFTVHPPEGEIFVEYASKSWLEAAGWPDIKHAYESYMSRSSQVSAKLLAVLRQNRAATLNILGFTTTGDIVRNVQLQGDYNKIELPSFSKCFNFNHSRPSDGSGINGLRVAIGHIEVTDDARTLMQELRASQLCERVEEPIVLGEMQLIYQAP